MREDIAGGYEQHDVDGRVIVQLGCRGLEFVQERRIDGVTAIGAIEAQLGDGAAALEHEGRVGRHGR